MQLIYAQVYKVLEKNKNLPLSMVQIETALNGQGLFYKKTQIHGSLKHLKMKRMVFSTGKQKDKITRYYTHSYQGPKIHVGTTPSYQKKHQVPILDTFDHLSDSLIKGAKKFKDIINELETP